MTKFSDKVKAKIPIKTKDNPNFDFDTALDIQIKESGYVAVWKDYRTVANLPTENSNGQPITWFNGFGAVDSNQNPLKTGEKVTFTVTLLRPPPAPNGTDGTARKICYYDSTIPGNDYKAKVRDVTEITGSDSNKIVFELTTGDPPTGMYP